MNDAQKFEITFRQYPVTYILLLFTVFLISIGPIILFVSTEEKEFYSKLPFVIVAIITSLLLTVFAQRKEKREGFAASYKIIARKLILSALVIASSLAVVLALMPETEIALRLKSAALALMSWPAIHILKKEIKS